MKKLKFPWGELIVVGTTEELSVGLDTIYPGTQTDQKGSYLKKGIAIYYVVDGRGVCGEKIIKKGDLLRIATGQEINLINNSKKNLKLITIYLPPYDDANIGHK